MILVDSNVLIDLIQNDAKWADWSEAQVRRLRSKDATYFPTVPLIFP